MIWILFIPTMAVSLWAAARVKAVCHRYNQGALRSGLSGVEVAHSILRQPDLAVAAAALGKPAQLRC